MSGIATICFLLIVQNKVPSYLGTSASFVGVATAIYAHPGAKPSDVTGAILVAGIVLAIVGLIVHFAGAGLVNAVLPPVVTGAVVMLIGFNLAPVAATTYMRSWQDFDKITLVQLPLFLFSGTFFPVSAFPTPVQWLVECTPLYRAVVLCRELTTGALSWGSVVSVVYLVVLGLAGLLVVRRRLDALLLT